MGEALARPGVRASAVAWRHGGGSPSSVCGAPVWHEVHEEVGSHVCVFWQLEPEQPTVGSTQLSWHESLER